MGDFSFSLEQNLPERTQLRPPLRIPCCTSSYPGDGYTIFTYITMNTRGWLGLRQKKQSTLFPSTCFSAERACLEGGIGSSSTPSSPEQLSSSKPYMTVPYHISLGRFSVVDISTVGLVPVPTKGQRWEGLAESFLTTYRSVSAPSSELPTSSFHA